jgi:LPS-assembly lipoprotein
MHNRRAFAARAALILAAPALLASCGFALKGSAQLPFTSLFLDQSESGPTATALRRQLQGVPGLTLLELPAQRAQAQVVLQIDRDNQDKRSIGANAYGLTRELQLTSHFDYRLVAADGRELGQAVQLNQRRDINYNEAIVLSKEGEEAMLYRDMAEDLAAQVMRRLAATR